MAERTITGRTTDGAVVFDDVIDSRGRRVIDATNRILEDGTHYFALPVTRDLLTFLVK